MDVGHKVFLIGGVDGPFTFGLNPLTQGSKGSDVMEVQKRLAGYGFMMVLMTEITANKLSKLLKLSEGKRIKCNRQRG